MKKNEKKNNFNENVEAQDVIKDTQEPVQEPDTLPEDEAVQADQPDELTEIKGQLLRSLAEYDNYRKRSTKEKEAAFTNGMSYAVEKLIPVLDTLAMAEASPCTDEEFKKGITLTMQKAQNAFEALGVIEIAAEGERFDPELHAAVMQEQGEEPGMVMKVLQKGYRIGDKVIRHSTVSVSE